MKTKLLFEQESYEILGACFEVYREKGCGFLEPVYQECMEIELRLRGVPFVAQKPLALEYKGCPLRAKYEPDFICYGKIILELKAVGELADEHRAQVQNSQSDQVRTRATGQFRALSQGSARANCGGAGPIRPWQMRSTAKLPPKAKGIDRGIRNTQRGRAATKRSRD
jgi:GxxExxY protein